MERIKALNLFQKCMMIILALMVVGFAVLYGVTTSRVGIEYNDAILVPGREGSATVYSGKIKGQEAVFTVAGDTAEFKWGSRSYGTYTLTEDPDAAPEDVNWGLTGVELRRDGEIMFRGGVTKQGDKVWIFDENGEMGTEAYGVTANGALVGTNGKVIDPMEPTEGEVLRIMMFPEMTHKGMWAIWVVAVLLCLSTAVSILFADELFRFKMSFSIRNAYSAEPSELEVAGRYIAWVALPIAALVMFIMGLR